jgi:hypothetical protein
MKTGISEQWSIVAKVFLGKKSGKHCHWCKYHLTEEGEVTCINEKSKFCDEGRIRSWDGIYCAKKCGLFELEDWYKDDKNCQEYFKKKQNTKND